MPDLADRAMHLATVCGHPLALSYAHTAKAIAAHRRGPSRCQEEAALGRAFALQAGDFWAYAHAALWEGNAIDFWSAPETSDFMAACRHEATSAGAPHPYAAWLATNEAGGRLSAGRWEECAALLRICRAEPGGLVEVAARLIAARFAVLQGRRGRGGGPRGAGAGNLCRPVGFHGLPVRPCAGRGAARRGRSGGRRRLRPGDSGRARRAAHHVRWLPGGSPGTRGSCPAGCRPWGGQHAGHAASRRARGRFPVVLQDNGLGLRRFRIRRLDVISPFYRRQLLALDAWYRAEVGRSHSRPDNAEEWEKAATLLLGADLPWEATYAGWRAGEATSRHQAGPVGGRRWLRDTLETATRLRAEPVSSSSAPRHGRGSVWTRSIRSASPTPGTGWA